MFNGDIRLSGKHASYIRFLNGIDESNNIKFFDRYIDVFMISAVVGFIYGKKEEVDTTSEYKDVNPVTIFLETIMGEKNNLSFIHQTMMLLDDKDSLSPDDRINRAFRDKYSNGKRHIDNMDLFYSYVRGGISFIYDKITNNAYDISEYLRNLKEFIDDFNNDFISDKYLEDIDIDKDKSLLI